MGLVDQILGGGGALCAPSESATGICFTYPFYYSILSSVVDYLVVSHDKNKRNRHHNNKFAVKHKKSNSPNPATPLPRTRGYLHAMHVRSPSPEPPYIGEN